MAAPISLEPTVHIGEAVELFQHSGLIHNGTVAQCDVAADGERFAIRQRQQEEINTATIIQVVENWYEEFRDRLPGSNSR